MNQLSSIKTGIEIAISMLIPCLLPGVGIGMLQLCPRAAELLAEKLTDFEVLIFFSVHPGNIVIIILLFS